MQAFHADVKQKWSSFIGKWFMLKCFMGGWFYFPGGWHFPSTREPTLVHLSFIVPPVEKMLHHEKSLLGSFLTSDNSKQILTRNLESVE